MPALTVVVPRVNSTGAAPTPAGVVQRRSAGVGTPEVAHAPPPTVMETPGRSSQLPVSVSVVPPAVGPLVGVRLVTAGSRYPTVLTFEVAAPTLTRTSSCVTVPSEPGVEARTICVCVELVTTALRPPTVTTGVSPKLVPLKVSAPPLQGSDVGVNDESVGAE